MKKTFRLLSLALCFVTNFAVAADLRIEDPQSYADLRDKTFTPLFEALKVIQICNSIGFINYKEGYVKTYWNTAFVYGSIDNEEV